MGITMAESLEDIKKRMEEKKKTGLFRQPEKDSSSSVDLDKVESIVSRMKKKQAMAGISEERVGGKLGELRGIITEGKAAALKIQTVDSLKDSKNKSVKAIGQIYTSNPFVFKPLSGILSKLPIVGRLDYYLFSANMKYSAIQWLALSTVVAFVGAILLAVLTVIILPLLLQVNFVVTIGIALLLAIAGFFFIAIIALMIPRSRAKARGDTLSVELPFALRHMGTELKAGIGLYKTLQTIAVADYGVLSEEFSRTINEIEEGTDAQDSLIHFANRTQSKSLRTALTHVVRAMKVGGNLSDIMNDIAEDVSFELRMKMRDFAEKMNFFGVIFIFIAIVLPVFIAILGAITNAPIGPGGKSIFSALPLTVTNLTIFYLAIMPLILAFFVFYLYTIQPKV